MLEGPATIPEVNAATLAPVVRRALGSDAHLDSTWRTRPLRGGFGGQGLYRFDGQARVDDGTVPWSVVLKISPPPRPQDDPAAWDAPQREVCAYGSGFLAGLPGPLVAPRCLGLTEGPAGTTWLWLETITDERPGPWDLDRYALAACHVGHFNGASLVADSLPDETWFSRGWLRQYVAAEGAATARLTVADDAPALLRQCFPPAVVTWVRGLWGEREALLTALDRLPQTVCHHDAFRRNLFARRRADGTEQTVAVDWTFTGIGAIGAELAPLVMGSLLLFEVADAPPRDLVEAALAGYLMGLREVGWGGDEGLVRLGFLATAALLYTVCSAGFTVALLGDPSRYPAFEQSLGRPLNEAVASWVELWPFQVELVEEARRLLPISS